MRRVRLYPRLTPTMQPVQTRWWQPGGGQVADALGCFLPVLLLALIGAAFALIG